MRLYPLLQKVYAHSDLNVRQVEVRRFLVMERLSTKMNRAKDRARLVQLDITAPIRTYGIVDLLTARPHSTAQAIPEIDRVYCKAGKYNIVDMS